MTRKLQLSKEEILVCYFFFSSRRRHTRLTCDWSSDVCSSDLHTSVALSRVWCYSPVYDKRRGNQERQRERAFNHPEIQPARSGYRPREDRPQQPIFRSRRVKDCKKETRAQAYQAPAGIQPSYKRREDCGDADAPRRG